MSDPIDNNEDIFLPQSDRLHILSPEEYELLWGVPRFSQYDRDLFFTLTAPGRSSNITNRLFCAWFVGFPWHHRFLLELTMS